VEPPAPLRRELASALQFVVGFLAGLDRFRELDLFRGREQRFLRDRLEIGVELVPVFPGACHHHGRVHLLVDVFPKLPSHETRNGMNEGKTGLRSLRWTECS
jgi:hypothetical protein